MVGRGVLIPPTHPREIVGDTPTPPARGIAPLHSPSVVGARPGAFAGLAGPGGVVRKSRSSTYPAGLSKTGEKRL